jgi:hypothetical protein
MDVALQVRVALSPRFDLSRLLNMLGKTSKAIRAQGK